MTSLAIRQEIKGFVNHILSWDFYHDVLDDHAESEEARARVEHGNAEMRCIPVHFKSVDEYEEVFLPIFLEETKAQLHRSKYSERGPTEHCHYQTFAMIGENEEYLRLTLLKSGSSSGEAISYNRGDIVLLSQIQDPLVECATHCLAYTDSLRFEELTLILMLDTSSGENPRHRRVAEKIASKSDWYATKICSIATPGREYTALMALRVMNSKVSNAILNKSHNLEEVKNSADSWGSQLLRVPDALWRCVQDHYNEYQLDAIRQSRRRSGITLVQGPPGTGKTTTILGMLSVLLGHTPLGEEEAELAAMDGKEKRVKYSRQYAGQNEASRLKKILNGEISTGESTDSGEEDSVVCKSLIVLPEYAKPGYSDWMASLPINPLDNSFTLLNSEYSLRDDEKNKNSIQRNIRIVQMGDRNAILGSSSSVGGNGKNKVLVCAPSNAAIDEIVRRLTSDGLYGRDGEKYIPSVVRLGPNVHPSLAQYSLERMAQSVQIGTSTGSGKTGGDNLFDNKAKASVLRDSQIVCATLSVSGSADMKLLQNSKFETVVIDEASQSIEVSTLIPLQLGCTRLILVGDHKQLPATVFSKLAESHLYSRSLFERLHQSGYPTCILKRQLRMHPDIAKFPSDLFYDGEIENAPNILELIADQPWSREFPEVLGPLVFFDIEEGREKVSLQSKVNEEEVLFVEQLITMLIKRYGEGDALNKIIKRTAVVTPYSEQVRLLNERLRRLFNVTDPTKPNPLEVNTIDGFQGREKDIIIASTVRASTGSIGFLADIRRMNVMLTRARTNMWIVGHRETLAKDEGSPWAKLIKHIESSKKVVHVSHPIESFFGRVLLSNEEQAEKG